MSARIIYNIKFWATYFIMGYSYFYVLEHVFSIEINLFFRIFLWFCVMGLTLNVIGPTPKEKKEDGDE